MKYDVCVFGGCSLDQTFYEKIDQTYNKTPDVIAPGGKGANQAVAAAKAGAKTIIISRIGKDEIGQKIIDNLDFYDINTTCIEIEEGLNNDYSNIYIKLDDKDNDIKRFSGAINSFTTDMINKYKDVLLSSKIIVCQLKIPKEVTVELINFCNKNNKTLILTPCRPEKLSISEKENIELIDKISIITCNKKECKTIFKTDDIEECVTKYPNKLIVTLGSDGLMFHNGKRIVNMPAINVDVVDTTGAGDTLNGNLSAFLAKGMDLMHALRKAMYASAMKLTQKTAQAGMPYLEDLEVFIRNQRNKNFEYQEELNLVLSIIKEAYEKTKYQNFEIKSKADNTLVTNVDVAIEKYLLTIIKEKYPKDNFLTEENFPDNKLLNRTWIIDPVDGTAHFVKNDGFWGLQLAFYDKNEVKFSVIYLPVKNELFYAFKNGGAFVNNEKILPLEIVPLNQVILEFGGSLYKCLEEKKICFNKLMKDGKLTISNVLHINSNCISYTNLAMGRTDALIISTHRPWDVFPGEFLCRELGIPIVYLDGDQKIKLLTINDEVKNIIMSK